MLVKELIKVLKTADPNAKVIAEDTDTVFEAHAVAFNPQATSTVKPVVKILWLDSVLCECEACEYEYGKFDIVYAEDSERCKKMQEEDK